MGIVVNKKGFLEIAEMLNDFKLRHKHWSCTRTKRPLEKLTKWYQATFAFLMVIGLINFMSKPALLRQRILPSVGYVPCDIDATWTCYAIAYVAHCLGGVYTIITFVPVDCIFWTLLYYGYAEMKYIKDRLSSLNINEKCNGDDVLIMQEIAFLVEHHDKVFA